MLVFKISREYLDTGGNKTKDMHAMHLPNFIRISGVLFILVAVIEHVGPTIVSGHYIAVVRPDGVSWEVMSDAHRATTVKKGPSVGEESQACVVMYARAAVQ